MSKSIKVEEGSGNIFKDLDFLMRFLNQLNRNIEIRIIPSENREGQQRVIAV